MTPTEILLGFIALELLLIAWIGVLIERHVKRLRR